MSPPYYTPDFARMLHVRGRLHATSGLNTFDFRLYQIEHRVRVTA